MGTLEDVLGGQEAIEEAVVPVVDEDPAPDPAPEPVAAPRDEKGRFAPKGVEESAPPAPEDDSQPVPVKALQDERRKRQDLEQTVQQLQQQLASIQQPQTQPAPAPSLWEDEQGWQQHFGGEVASAAVIQSRLNMSEMLAAQTFPDFVEIWEPMNQFLVENPVIAAKATSDRHPWAFAYKAYKNATLMQELAATDVDSLKANLEAKIREQIEAEMKAAQPSPPSLPDSLADAQSARSSAGASSAPPTLNDILQRR